jgi:hypothetical protein
MLSKLFISFGWTRDDLKWVYLQVVAVAALITSGAFDIPYWCGQLSIPCPPTMIRWVQALAALVLWISAQNASSKLPGKINPLDVKE